MTKVRVIKYFKGPAFEANVWSSRNPYLRSGEIGYVLESGVTVAAKVGPGYWNDLGFIGEDIYPYADEITNPIGDASGNITNLKVIDIIRKMLSPYEVPQFQNIRLIVNGTASTADVVYMEVGQSITSVSVIYNLLNAQNLSGATPINVSANSDINEVDAADTGSIALSIISPPIQPALGKTIVITLRATHTNGETSGDDFAYITFRPRIMWVTSSQENITNGTTFMSQANQQFVVSSDYKLEYNVYGGGYLWIAIPEMFAPTNIKFTDLTNPLAPADYAMVAKGTISIYNGVGTYNYILYRSEYNLVEPTKLKIS